MAIVVVTLIAVLAAIVVPTVGDKGDLPDALPTFFLPNVPLTVEEHLGEQIAKYTISGELFFASSNDLSTMFDYAGDPRHVVIDFYDSHLWDASTVAALDSVTDKYAHCGKDGEIVGLNQASRRMRVRLGGMLDNGGH